MKHHIGIFLQVAMLTFLPMLVLWQLEYGFRVGAMALLTLSGGVIFAIGTRLRETD